jgi:hypothetical protein
MCRVCVQYICKMKNKYRSVIENHPEETCRFSFQTKYFLFIFQFLTSLFDTYIQNSETQNHLEWHEQSRKL